MQDIGINKTQEKTKGYDAIDRNKRKVQIKARHEHTANPKVTNFGPFNKIEKQLFDYALLVVLNEKYWVEQIWSINYKDVKK